MRDIKELIGMLMRVIDNAEVTEAEILELDFDAEGELLMALNEAYIGLLEFAHDRDLRAGDRALDHKERSVLRQSLSKIVQLSEAERRP
jgi:hypothetical protein